MATLPCTGVYVFGALAPPLIALHVLPLPQVIIATIEHTRKMMVLRLIVVILVVMHMQACLLGLSTMMADEKLDSWWGTHGYCWPEALYQLTPSDPIKSRCVSGWEQYTVCYHIVMGLAFKISWAPILTTVCSCQMRWKQMLSDSLSPHLSLLNSPLTSPPTCPHAQGPGIPFPNAESNALFRPFERAVFVTVGFSAALMGLYLAGAFVGLVTGRGGFSNSEQVMRHASHSAPAPTFTLQTVR